MPKGSWREFDDSFSIVEDEAASNHSKLKLDSELRVQRTRGGKGGKTVTVITGLEISTAEARKLLKRLKVHCGTGGTMKEEYLELQGDQVNSVIEFLNKDGYKPKKSGG